MSTIEDFENAPIGATATDPRGRKAVKMAFDAGRWELENGWALGEYGMCKRGFTLDQPAPTTAQEALDLAWNLAHPLKEGQVIPVGTWLVERRGDEFAVGKNDYFEATANDWDVKNRRTLDSLPDPEPDWLDAPAVLARLEAGEIATEPEVWIPVGDGMYARAYHNEHTNWQDLRSVTPLYPKETDS